MTGQAIGIDLGTYNSAAACVGENGQPQMIRSRYGPTVQGNVFPSFVRFDAQGNAVAFGEEARQQMAYAPDQVVWGVKRLMGRSFRQVENQLWRFAYRVEQGSAGGIAIRVGGALLTPVEVSARLLQWIVQDAAGSPFLVGGVRKAVITHPAYFDAVQTEQVRQAAQQAGLSEVELIPEPVAAALAYGVQLDASRPQFIIAVDWGAGTLDIAVVALRLVQGRPAISEVRPARGDVALGGIDMDDLLLARAIELYDLERLQPLVQRPSQTPGRDLPPSDTGLPTWMLRFLDHLGSPQPQAYQQPAAAPEDWADLCRLRSALEKAKIDLSRLPATREYVTYGGRPCELKLARTARDRLDRGKDWILLGEALQPLLDQLRQQVDFAIQQSGLRREDLNHLLLIGGPMHMPAVRHVLRGLFRTNRAIAQELDRLDRSGFPVEPMEAVARGAGLAAHRSGPGLGARPIPRDYGVVLGRQGDVLIHDGDPLPTKVPFPGELSHPGQPGDRVPVGLFKRETGPGKPAEGEYTQLGDYEFTPTFDGQGRSRFMPVLEADRDGIITLVINDLLSHDALRLERLSLLDGRLIPEPVSFQRGPAEDTGRGPRDKEKDIPPPQPVVSEEEVARLRRAATSMLGWARDKEEDARVRADTGLRQGLQQKARWLDDALRALPSSGPADQQTFARTANRLTELRSYLDVHQLLTPEQRRLLF